MPLCRLMVPCRKSSRRLQGGFLYSAATIRVRLPRGWGSAGQRCGGCWVGRSDLLCKDLYCSIVQICATKSRYTGYVYRLYLQSKAAPPLRFETNAASRKPAGCEIFLRTVCRPEKKRPSASTAFRRTLEGRDVFLPTRMSRAKTMGPGQNSTTERIFRHGLYPKLSAPHLGGDRPHP